MKLSLDQDHQDLRDQKGHEGNQEQMVKMDHLARLAHKDLEALRETEVCSVHWSEC